MWCVHGGRSAFGNSVPHDVVDGVCRTLVSPIWSDVYKSKLYRAMGREQRRKQRLGLQAFVWVARVAAISTDRCGS